MLIELMVGLSIAALAIGAAIASLLMARDATSSVTELSLLQQQASHALRVLALQIRPAGSLDLEGNDDAPTLFRFPGPTPVLEGHAAVVHGEHGDANDNLSLAHLAPHLLPGQRHDCIGKEFAAGQRMDASFHVDAKGSLRCRGSTGQVQPLVAGVTAFRVRYRVRNGNRVRIFRAAEIEQAQLWPAVVALEICLDLRADERSAAYAGHYIDCNGRSADTGARLHLVTHKLFQLRAQEGS